MTPVSNLHRSRRVRTSIVLILLASGSFASAVLASPAEQGVVQSQATVRVMTQNLFMGTDFPELLAAQTLPEFLHAVTTTYNNVLATQPAERMAAVAREIARLQPDLVGLQEAAILRTGSVPPATDVVVDMLQLLLSDLDQLGQHYVAAAILTGLDAEAPSDQGFEVRFTVQDVILARTDRVVDPFRLSNVQMQQYQNQLTFQTPVGLVTNPAGWASVDVQGLGWRFRFVTTHLAIAPNFDPTIPFAQAMELRATAANTRLPLVVVGDFNSVASDRTNPTFRTYKSFVDAGFVDTWRLTHPGDPGFTCCQSPDVSNPTSSLSFRIDLVLTHDNVGIVNTRLVGAGQADRTPTGLWPSDHAGVIAILQFDQQ